MPEAEPCVPLPDDPRSVIKARSRWWTKQIGRSFERLAVRHFNQVRIAKWGTPQVTTAPLAVCSNHPGWWDPVAFVLLHRRYFADLASFGPMDEKAFRQYPFFSKLGIFGIEPDSARGAKRFLKIAQAVFSETQSCLWITGQGHFADVREPLTLKSGLARAAVKAENLTILPLAIEYVFWQEKLPEMLVAFGNPVRGHNDVAGWQDALTTELSNTMQRLAVDASSRDPARFITLMDGTKGIGGLYDNVRRISAWVQGKQFHAAHQTEDK